MDFAEQVSILARPEGRALRAKDFRIVLSLEFQSSPDPKAGRYLAVQERFDIHVTVSILARPEGWPLRA